MMIGLGTLAEPLASNEHGKIPTEVLVGADLKLVWVVVEGRSWGQHVQVQAQRLDGTPLMVVASAENGVTPDFVALALPYITTLLTEDAT